MNLKALFRKYSLDKVKINLQVAEAEISLNSADEDAAWELYVEMLTRIVTQPLPSEHGDEKTALDSVFHSSQLPAKFCADAAESDTLQQGCDTCAESGSATLYREVA